MTNRQLLNTLNEWLKAEKCRVYDPVFLGDDANMSITHDGRDYDATVGLLVHNLRTRHDDDEPCVVTWLAENDEDELDGSKALVIGATIEGDGVHLTLKIEHKGPRG